MGDFAARIGEAKFKLKWITGLCRGNTSSGYGASTITFVCDENSKPLVVARLQGKHKSRLPNFSVLYRFGNGVSCFGRDPRLKALDS